MNTMTTPDPVTNPPEHVRRDAGGLPLMPKTLRELLANVDRSNCGRCDVRDLLAAMVERIEQCTTNPTRAGSWDDLPGYKELYNDSAASPAAASPPMNINKCPKCGAELVCGALCVPCNEFPAAACARAGGIDGSSTASAGQPNTETTTKTHGKSASSARPAADAPAVPEWESKLRFIATDHRAKIVSGFPRITINTLPEILRDEADAIDAALQEVAALRASRDHWRERAERAEKRADNQLATLTEYQQAIGAAVVAFCDPEARRRDDPAAEKFYARWRHCIPNHPEKPESSWRERCRVVEKTDNLWDVVSPCGKYFFDGCDWYLDDDPGIGFFDSWQEALSALSTIPTPPPEAKP